MSNEITAIAGKDEKTFASANADANKLSGSDSDTAVEWRFTWRKILFVGAACLWSAYFVAFFFAIFGNTFFSMRPFVASGSEYSFLLFPGRNLRFVDVIYLATLPFDFLIFSVYLPSSIQKKVVASARTLRQELNPVSSAILALCLVFVMHMLGNLHYQFYYHVGVVPPENHFALYDIRSFGCGFAGLFLVSTICGAIYAILFALWYVASLRLCFEQVRVDETDVVDEPSAKIDNKSAFHSAESSV